METHRDNLSDKPEEKRLENISRAQEVDPLRTEKAGLETNLRNKEKLFGEENKSKGESETREAERCPTTTTQYTKD